MDGVFFSSHGFDLSQEDLSASTSEYKRVNGTFYNHITSHHIQSLTGGFVGLCFERCADLSLLFEHQHVWGLLPARRDVLNMSDPGLDQSSHHSRSVREDKMQTVTSGLLAAAAAKAQNLL